MPYSIAKIKRKRQPGRPQRYRWRATVNLNWSTERKRYLTVVSKSRPTESLAVAWALEYLETALGNKQIRSKLNVGATVEQLLREYIKQGKWRSKSTIKRYQSFLKNPIATRLCLNLTHDDGVALQAGIVARGLANSSVVKEMTSWKTVMNYGVRNSYLEFNPWKHIKLDTPKRSRDRLPTTDELVAFGVASGYATHAGAPRNAGEAAVCAWNISCITGLRQNEIASAAEHWITRAEFPSIELPGEITKSGKGRVVPLEPAAMEHINRLVPDPETGNYFNWTARQISEAFGDIRKELGIGGRDDDGGLVYHDSRHYAVTRLLEILKPNEVMSMVGHKDAEMLLIYSQPEAQAIAAKLGACSI